MERIIIKPYNIEQLDGMVMPLGNKIDLYFDNVRSEFTAMVYHDLSNRAHVYYSKCQSRHYTEECKQKYPDFHDTLDAMINECVQNIMGMYLDNGVLYSTIAEVEYIPELRGLNFKTAGYIIGHACATEVILNHGTSVQYVIGNNSYSIEGDMLQIIANRYIVKDISDSSSLGYLYYNKSRAITDAKGDSVRVAQNNDRRFGSQTSVKSISNLMRDLTNFIPIGYSWSVYTPIWIQDKDFMSRLINETEIGADFVEVPNLTFDGNAIPDFKSVTYYTTMKRLHRVLGEKFESYNFRFFNELIAGLYLDGRGYTSAKYAAINANNQKKYITPLEYEALIDDEKARYIVSSGNQDMAAKALAVKLIKTYWSTMNVSKPDISTGLIERVQNFSMDSIKCNSSAVGLFNYHE